MAKHFLQEEKDVYILPDGTKKEYVRRKYLVHHTEDDPFYMTFLRYVKWIYGLTGVAPFKLLLKLIDIAQFNTGRVSLTTGKRKEIIDELCVSEVAFYKSLKQLLDQEVLYKVYKTDPDTGEQIEMKGEFFINPDMFWKGELNKRKELRVIFEAPIDDEIKG